MRITLSVWSVNWHYLSLTERFKIKSKKVEIMDVVNCDLSQAHPLNCESSQMENIKKVSQMHEEREDEKSDDDISSNDNPSDFDREREDDSDSSTASDKAFDIEAKKYFQAQFEKRMHFIEERRLLRMKKKAEKEQKKETGKEEALDLDSALCSDYDTDLHARHRAHDEYCSEYWQRHSKRSYKKRVIKKWTPLVKTKSEEKFLERCAYEPDIQSDFEDNMKYKRMV